MISKQMFLSFDNSLNRESDWFSAARRFQLSSNSGARIEGSIGCCLQLQMTTNHLQLGRASTKKETCITKCTEARHNI